MPATPCGSNWWRPVHPCVHARIFSRDRDRLLTEIVYAPESTNRLNRVTPVEFCDRLGRTC